jgi:hypothetical protein
LQVNTEAGDHEEKKNADVPKRACELDQANGILKEVVWKNLLALYNGVINDNAHGGSASKRVDATQAFWGNGHPGNS